MGDQERNFHEIAIKSILFKGRNDWYFCYLKSEKIAHVLGLLLQSVPLKEAGMLEELAASAARLPHTITHFVAGEMDAAVVLADIFSLLSLVRLAGTHGYVRPENARILSAEYEDMVRKIAAQSHPSPFITSQDFTVEEIGQLPPRSPLPPLGSSAVHASAPGPIKDNYKGQSANSNKTSKGQGDRASQIYEFVKARNGVSIKDIAAVVRGCSEKTIQRELTRLIKEGLIQRKGEKRWSLYVPTPSFK
jgi:hypothetical protein